MLGHPSLLRRHPVLLYHGLFFFLFLVLFLRLRLLASLEIYFEAPDRSQRT
jgi:hypothetical protein